MNAQTHNAFPNGRWSSGSFNQPDTKPAAMATAAAPAPTEAKGMDPSKWTRHFALLRSTSPFFPIFRPGHAPIKPWITPLVGEMEGFGPSSFYWLDVKRCSDEQIRAVAAIVGQQCNGMPAAVEEYMRKEGQIPLRTLHILAVMSAE